MFQLTTLLFRSRKLDDIQSRADAAEANLAKMQQQLSQPKLSEVQAEQQQVQEDWQFLIHKLDAIETKIQAIRSLLSGSQLEEKLRQ